MEIMPVELEDAEALLEIYAPYVRDTAVSFEYEVPSLSDFQDRICSISSSFPYLKAVENGEILGYAYAGKFKSRKAYDWSVEVTVYVRQAYRRLGVGQLLYYALELVLKRMGVLNMNACIARPKGEDLHLSDDSYRFHEAMGFRMVGTFHDCGYKFDSWYDMVWMEKMIGEHSKNPREVRYGACKGIIAIVTDRLILRPWEESDAESLYEYAKHPEVGPIAGWPVHTSVENSKEIIREVLSSDETYAVCLKEDNRAIGSIGLISPAQSHTKASESELEVGYWIGVPFWGHGYVPEAVNALLKHAFEELHCTAMWCGYYDGNEKSKRCQEKCGFKYHHTEENKPCVLMGDIRTEHFTYLTKEEWQILKR